MKIYLASPISGRTPQQVFTYFDDLSHELREAGYETLQPMTGKDEMRTSFIDRFVPTGYTNPVAANHSIFERDTWMVRQADAVFVYLPDNGIVSIGCMMELAIASDIGKHTMVVIEGETNVHRH